MKVELDDYEVQRIKFLIQDEMSELKKSSESKLFNDDTKKCLKDDYKMFEDILIKLAS